MKEEGFALRTQRTILSEAAFGDGADTKGPRSDDSDPEPFSAGLNLGSARAASEDHKLIKPDDDDLEKLAPDAEVAKPEEE